MVWSVAPVVEEVLEDEAKVSVTFPSISVDAAAEVVRVIVGC